MNKIKNKEWRYINAMLETMLEEVKVMIEERKFSKLKKYLEDFNSADIPWFFEELNDEEIILVFRLLSKDVAAEVFVELEPDLQEKLIGFFTERELKAVMDELFMDDKERQEIRLPRIHDIPLDLIDDFPGHPYQVRMDEDMDQLVESIKERGIITPVTLHKIF